MQAPPAVSNPQVANPAQRPIITPATTVPNSGPLVGRPRHFFNGSK
jgi:hypothetical protein